jgi:nitroreductase
VDAAIVATHMMLAAHDLGVGCCWVMHFNPAAMRQIFAIPEGTEPLALLMLGYPAADAKPIAMHFKTRPMEETVVWDSF